VGKHSRQQFPLCYQGFLSEVDLLPDKKYSERNRNNDYEKGNDNENPGREILPEIFYEIN
jgi:hypothetical protein